MLTNHQAKHVEFEFNQSRLFGIEIIVFTVSVTISLDTLLIQCSFYLFRHDLFLTSYFDIEYPRYLMSICFAQNDG